MALSYLPVPDYYHFSFPSSHVVLLCDDGSDASKALLHQLAQKGLDVVSLSFRSDVADNTVPYNISNANDLEIGQVIETIRNEQGPIGGCIFMHPHTTFKGSQYDQQFKAEREWIKKAFLLAKYLKNDLCTLGEKTRSFFIAVSRLDGQLGHGDQHNMSIVGGALHGLVKSLGLEWPSVFCRSLDIHPKISAKDTVNHIWSEMHDPSRLISEVAIHQTGRRTLVGELTPIKDRAIIESDIQTDDVFIVSGGARGVTARCVIEMAKAFQSTFILMGRSDISFQLPDYAKDCDDDAELMKRIRADIQEKGQKPSLQQIRSTLREIKAKKEIDHTLFEIEGQGSSCYYLQVDVTNIVQVKRQVKEIITNTGNITGIIHGAGRLADKYIQDKTEIDFDNVLSVKLDGLQAMLAAVDHQYLKHMILFSSVAGFYGNVGQTDYAMANEILSKLALLFKKNHPELRIKAINWGAWDSGMVSGALKKKFEEMGVSLVNSDGGPCAMVHEMSNQLTSEAQVILGGTLPSGEAFTDGDLREHVIDRHLKLDHNSFLQHHVIQEKAVLPVVNAITWMTATAEQVYHGYTTKKIIDAQLFKGIVFDGNQLESYSLQLSELRKTNDEVVLKAQIYSQQPDMKLPTYHYRAEIHLIKKSIKRELKKINVSDFELESGESGAYLYEDGSLFHGSFFRGIEKIIKWNKSQIILSCKAPVVPLKDQGQFAIQSINSFFADIQYQGMVIWVQKYMDQARSLPLSTQSCTLYNSIPFDQLMYVKIDIIECTDHKLVANCTTFDKEGTIYMITEHATVTISKDLTW